MINRVSLTGYICNDLELKYTPNQVAYLYLTLAVDRNYVKENGEKQTDFVNCRVGNKMAENLCIYQEKGCLIGIDGCVRTYTVETAQGERRTIMYIEANEVHYFGSKKQQNS